MKPFVYMLSFFAICMFGFTACKEAPKHTHVTMEKGEFWADLLIMPEEELSEFDKPSDQKLKISSLSVVSEGERIALKMLFSAMELDANSSADVTYDTEMVRPDGSISEAVSQNNLVARQGKVSAPLNVHNSDTVLILAFDSEDKRGTYVINVVVRDNIGNEEISISKTLNLID